MGIEPGRYVGRARPETLLFGYARNNTEQVGMNIEIMNEGYEGQSVPWYGSFASDKSTEITLRQLRTAGWAGDNITDTAGLGEVEVEVEVRYETFEGKERMKTSIFPKGGFVVQMDKPIEGGALSALNAKLKGAIIKSKPKGPAAAKSAGWTPPPRSAQSSADWDGQGREPGVD